MGAWLVANTHKRQRPRDIRGMRSIRRCVRLVATHPTTFRETLSLIVDVREPAQVEAGTSSQEQLTTANGEGIVVKP